MATKIIGQIAAGLKTHSASYCKLVFNLILQKCKDKKTLPEAKKCLETFVGTLKIEDISDGIKEALLDKSPQIKLHICSWMETSVFPKISVASAKTLTNSIFQPIIKLTDDASSEVRDAALNCLGVMKYIVHDYSLNKVLQELNLQKQEKIMKAAEGMAGVKKEEDKGIEKMEDGGSAESKKEAEKSEDNTSKNQLEPATENIRKRSVTPTPTISHQQQSHEEKPIGSSNNIGGIPIEQMKGAFPEGNDKDKSQPMEMGNNEEVKVKKPPTIKKESKKNVEGSARPATAAAGNKQKEIIIHEEDLGPEPEEEEMKTKISGMVSADILSQFDNSDWKERQKGYQMLGEWITKNKEATQSNIVYVTFFIKCKLKDFKENNQGILKEGFALINNIAINFNLSKLAARAFITGVAEKIGDTKLMETTTEILFNISDSATPSYVSNQVLKIVLPAKSLPLIKSSLGFFVKMINEYSTMLLPIKSILEYAKQSLNHSNPQVRNASISVITTLYSFVGDSLKVLISQNIKEATLKTVEAELDKTEKKSQKEACEIKRKLRGDSEQEAQTKLKSAASAADALVPRVNIAPQITTKLIANLTDSGMKVRQEAKDNIEKMLLAANQRIQPTGLGPLFNALKSRMNEPCKNLAKSLIALVGNLVIALGPSFKTYNKIIMQPLMYNLADKQGYIRTETLSTMNKIADSAGAEMIINNVSTLLEKDNPEMRAELLNWILKRKEALGKSDSGSLVTGLVACLQDRGKEIRGLAEELITEVMNKVGFQVFASAIQDLKPIVKNSLKGVLEKLKPAVEAKEEPMQIQTKKPGESDKPEPMIDTVPAVINQNEAPKVPAPITAEPVIAKPPPAVPVVPQMMPAESVTIATSNLQAAVAVQQPAMIPQTINNIVVPSAAPVVPAAPGTLPVPMTSATQAPPSPMPVASVQHSPIKHSPQTEDPDQTTPNRKPGTAKTKNTTILNQKKKPSNVRVLNNPPPEASLASSRSTNDLAKGVESETSGKKSQAGNANMTRMASQKAILQGTLRKPSSKAKLLKDSPSKTQVVPSSIGESSNFEKVVLHQITVSKEKRAEQDKGVKWPIDEVRDNLVDKLKKAMIPVFNPGLLEMMFAIQFKKNLEAVKYLTEGLQTDFTSMVDVLDLLLKYITLKMVDQSNTAINKAILEFLRILFAKLGEMSYQMLDYEAGVIIPMLCERTGVSNAGFKEDIKNLITLVGKIYSPLKLSSYVMKAFESKNQKTKIECLILMREMIAEHGMKLVSQKEIKVFAKFLTFGDQTIKNEAISVLEEIYKRKGETIWTYLTEISEKNKEMLKQKFKYIDIVAAENTNMGNTTATSNFLAESSYNNGIELMKGDKEDDEEYKAVIGTGKKSPKFADAVSKVIPMEEGKEKANAEEIIKITSKEEKTEVNPQLNQTTIPIASTSSTLQVTQPLQPMAPATTSASLAISSVVARPPTSAPAGDTSPQSISPLKPNTIQAQSIKMDSLEGILELLKKGDMSKRVDALVSLNEKTTSQFEQNKDALKLHCDHMMETFAEVLQTIFEGKNPQEIPIRFAKYFMSVINKICSLKAIVKDCSKQSMSLLVSQLLQILIYEGLDKLGENNEGENMMKSLNVTMLRIMENCDPTNVFCTLLELFKNYRKASPPTAGMVTYINLTKIPALIVKCLLKLTKVIDSLIPNMDIAKILLSIHEYLLVYPSNPQLKTQNDEIGTRMVKTIINELVRNKREAIWDYYQLVQKHEHPDTHINRWITIILKSFYTVPHTPSRPPTTPTQQAPSTAAPHLQPKESPDELKEIFKGLNSQATFYEAIKSLSEYLDRHPHLDVAQYFTSCSKAFTDYVMNSMQKYRSQQKTGLALAEATNTPIKPGAISTSFLTSTKKSTAEVDAGSGANLRPT